MSPRYLRTRALTPGVVAKVRLEVRLSRRRYSVLVSDWLEASPHRRSAGGGFSKSDNEALRDILGQLIPLPRVALRSTVYRSCSDIS